MAFQAQQHQHGVDQYGNPVAATGVVGAAPGGGGGGVKFQPAAGEGRKTTGAGILRRSGSSSSSSSSEDDGMGGRRKKGIKEKIKEKLPGAHKGQPQQQNIATTAGGGTHGLAGTGAHGVASPGAGGGYVQQPAGITGVVGAAPGGGTGAHGAMGTGEKKGVKEKIKEKLPVGYKAEQHTVPTAGGHGHAAGMHGSTTTGGAYEQQAGHPGVTGAGAGGAYGQPAVHAPGVVGTGAPHAAAGAGGQKKGVMDKIKEKLPGQH